MTRSRRSLALLAGFVLFAASCRATTGDTNTFLLRTAQPNVVAASNEVTNAVYRQLQAGGVLAEGCPVRGHLVTEPDLSDPGVERMSCAPGSSGEADETRCILLSEAGDFIRVRPITWQSEAAYTYRIYVASRSLIARVDPAKDFVAVDVFGPDDTVPWQPVDQAIRSAAAELGARPFRP
jgi:hypothetical protein